MFQRLGAMGVAVSGIYYGLIRFGVGVPEQLPERLYWTKKSVILNSRAVHLALQNNSMLAHAIEKQCQATGEIVPTIVSALAQPAKDGYLRDPRSVHVEAEVILDDLLKIEIDANSHVERVRSSTARSQLAIAVIATLQGGFGDLIVNRLLAGAT